MEWKWTHSYLRKAERFNIENVQRHLFKVNTFDHKDDARFLFVYKEKIIITNYT